MTIKELSVILGLIAAIVVGWIFVDERFFHREEAAQMSERVILRDTARQIDITDLKIKSKAAKQTLSPEEEVELESLKTQQKILIEQLKDLEKKQ